MVESTERGRRAGRRAFLRSAGGAAGAAAALGLAGCGGAGAPTGSVAGTTTGGSAAVIDLIDVAGARSRALYEEVVARVEEATGRAVDLRFTEVPYGSMRQELFTRVGGGNPPDVAAIDQIWLGAFVDSDALLPLDGVADDVDYDDFLDPFAAPGRQGGHVYALPIGTDVRGMYWNRERFADAGLDPDSPPATWAEFFDIAAQVHDPPETYGAVQFVVGGRWTVQLFAAGGRVLDDDRREPRFQEAPGVRAATFLDRLYNEAAVGPPEPPYSKGAQTAREFLKGTYAMTVVEGSWLDYFWRNMGRSNDEMVERFGFAPTPHPADGEVATMSGGFAWAGLRGTDHPDLVREFLRVAASPEFQRHLAIETGDIPTRESLLDDEAVWADVLYSETVKDLLRHTRTRPVRNWSPVAEALDPALQRVAFDRADPGAALAAAAEEVRSALG